MNNNLSGALTHAARGWKVFPCKADKSPYTDHGMKDASTDEAQIKGWWDRWPDALIGVYCEGSNFFAVDVDADPDPEKDGRKSWDDLVTKYGNGAAFDKGPSQKTPSGGWHILFNLPQDVKVPNNAGKLAPGIDLRSSGYIIVAPTAGYSWFNDHSPDDLPLTDAPGWLLDGIENLSKKRRPQNQVKPLQPIEADDPGEYWLKHYLGITTKGNRNNNGFELACQLRDSGLAEIDASFVMQSFASLAPGGDYTEAEALAAMRSAYSQTPREPAKLPGAKQAANAPRTHQEAPGDALDIDEMLLYQPTDHEGHAQCVNAIHKETFNYSEHLGWMFYNGRYWQRDNAEVKAEGAITNTLKERRTLAVQNNQDGIFENLIKKTAATSFNVSGTKFLLRNLAAIDVSDFDSDPDLLNCKNGVLDLRTGELQEHNRDQKFTYCLPVDYDPQADYDRWETFLLEAIGYKVELLAWLKQAVGYSLTGHTWEEVLFYIYGPARAGKGTFTETIIRMLGDKPLSTETDFSTFTSERYGDTQNFDLAPLKPCRFVAASESNKKQPLNPAAVKRLTGGNYIYCAFKHREHFTYKPQYKIWLSSNHPVNVDVDDDAAWSRVKVIEFPTSMVGHEDKGLKHDLATADNLKGVLAWAVEGVKEWYAAGNKGLSSLGAIEQATQDQRDAQDFVRQFLDEETIADSEGWISSGDLWSLYDGWCEDNGVTPKHRNQFTRSLTTKGYESRSKRELGKITRGIQGLRSRGIV